MNDKGVWIVYTDRYGETVTRHQLTTVQDMTIAEEDSAVSNACNIVRSLRSMLYRYRGIANVTNDLTAQLKIDLISSLEQIRARKYSYHVGPQVIDYKINELGMDPDNAARIMVDVDIDVPEPLLDGNFKFNIV
jgi:predicted kinase